MVYFNCIRTPGNCLLYKKSLSFSIVKPTRCANVSNLFSSSIGTTAHCGLWPVELCPSIFSYLPRTLSIFSLPALEDLFLLPLSIFSWVFPFFSSLPVLEWRSFWVSYPSSLKFILFYNDTLHVSEGLSVHHQDFKTVHTATGICQTDTAVCLLAAMRCSISYPLASRQQYLFVADDERKDRPKHVECHSKIK